MKKIYNEDFLETYYTKTLASGLKVVLFEKPDFHNNFFTLLTPYGAADYNQIDEHGNKYHLPPGVAHFLEHRMFDYQGFDVMEKFSEYGSSSNASTGYEMTQYYFSTTNDEYRKSLKLLLDFVFDLTIPPASVEKEKGIIIEELMMYDGMADFKLYFSMLKNLYHHLPFNEDIGGSVESVSKTTLADLELAYKLNYHPAQMYLVGATNDDIEDTFKFIEDVMSDKTFSEAVKLERDYPEELESVANEYSEFDMDLNNGKLAIGYKFKHGEFDPLKIDLMENLLDIYLDMLFSSVNPKYQDWLDQDLVNDYFDVDIALDEDYGHIFVSGEGNDIESFTKFIEDIFNNDKEYISEAKFNQLLKKSIGRAILSLEQPGTIAQVYGRNIVNGLDVFEGVNNLKNRTLKDLEDLLAKLDLIKHRSQIVISKKS